MDLVQIAEECLRLSQIAGRRNCEAFAQRFYEVALNKYLKGEVIE